MDFEVQALREDFYIILQIYEPLSHLADNELAPDSIVIYKTPLQPNL